MEFADQICGYSKWKIRDLFKAFLDLPTPVTFTKKGLPVFGQKTLTANFIASTMALSTTKAHALRKCLAADDWIEDPRGIPSSTAMALSQELRRPKLPRKTADEIVRKIVAWAHRVNARQHRRIRIESIELFGSYETSQALLGDVDVVLLLNSNGLKERGEYSEEDSREEEQLTKELLRISRYISPVDLFQKMLLPTGTRFRRIFPKKMKR